jgi:hypothetical protein
MEPEVETYHGTPGSELETDQSNITKGTFTYFFFFLGNSE